MKIHISNAADRDATVIATSIPVKEKTIPAKNGQPVEFKRYVAAGEKHLHENLAAQFNKPDYSEELIKGDPEIDFEIVGRAISNTSTLLLDSERQPIYCAPEVFEITYGPDGSEQERKIPVDIAPNVNDELPIKWTGKLFEKSEFVRKFGIKRTMQIQHVDGVTFDYLFGIAKELHEKNSVMLLGGGAGGKSPLVLSSNGTPYRGFLEGRIKDSSFLLLLHLSNMELKKPAAKSKGDE